MTLSVLIVDDHEVTRQGLSELLASRDFLIAGLVGSGKEAIEVLESGQRVDVVLLDIRMPKVNGFDTLEQIRIHNERLCVVVLSAYDNPTYIARAAALGARDFLLKSSSSSALVVSLNNAVASKKPPLESRMGKMSQMMGQEIDANSLPPEIPLTGREAQVLRHVAFGLSNKEIARSLEISVETIKEHVQNILRKMNATDRTDAAVRAVRLGLADSPNG